MLICFWRTPFLCMLCGAVLVSFNKVPHVDTRIYMNPSWVDGLFPFELIARLILSECLVYIYSFQVSLYLVFSSLILEHLCPSLMLHCASYKEYHWGCISLPFDWHVQATITCVIYAECICLKYFQIEMYKVIRCLCGV